MTRWGILAVAALGVALSSGAAQATAREDVLAGAIRCGGVGNDRQWLDCYYGAAQPMRAQLRLSPAPQAAMAPALAQGGVVGGVRQDVLSAAIRCGSVGEDRPWLDCYYGAAQPMRAQLGLSPAPQAMPQQALAPRPPAQPQAPQQQAYVPPPGYTLQKTSPHSQDFPGFFQGVFGDDPVVFKSTLLSYSFDQDGYLIAKLANGQVWHQTSGDIGGRWNKPASHYHVTLTRGMMRTYNLRVEGDPRLYKVKRVS